MFAHLTFLYLYVKATHEKMFQPFSLRSKTIEYQRKKG